MRVGQKSVIVFVSKVFSSILGLAGTLLFARLLGAEVIGYYAITIVLGKWLRMGGEVGIASAVTKRVSESDNSEAYFTAGLVIVGVFSIVLVLGTILFRSVINSYVGTDVALFVALIVLVGLPSTIITSALSGERRVHLVGILGTLQVGARSIAQIALVLAGFGLIGMLTGYAIGMLIIGIAGATLLSLGISRPTKEHVLSLLDFAKYSWLGSLKSRSFADIDFIILGVFVSPVLVGIYQIAWNITNFIGIFGSSITATTFPELSRADSEQRDELFGSIMTEALINTGIFAIPGFFGALIIGDRVLRIYGDEFTRGVAVLGILIMSKLIYDYQSQLVAAMNALDRPDLSFRINAIFVGTNVALNLILVWWIGWVGAAIATAISAGVGLTLAFWHLRILLELEFPIIELGRQILSAGIMSGIVFLAEMKIGTILAADNNALMITILVTLGSGIYFITLLSISRRFRNTVAENAPDRIPFIS